MLAVGGDGSIADTLLAGHLAMVHYA